MKKAKGQDFFYLISVDVGRIVDQTVVTIFKVSLSSRVIIRVVNIYVLGLTAQSKDFYAQAADLKRIIAAFDPKEVVMDGTGLGVGLLDAMTKTQVTEAGEIFGPIGSFNNPDLMATQPHEAPKLIYVLKASPSVNSKIHANCYAKIASGAVRFLISEQDAKVRLMATEKGQKMRPEQRIARLRPHHLTTILHEEMGNLRLKKNSVSTEIALEQVNRKIGKDKFSSLEYGLWRIRELEDIYEKENSRKVLRNRELVFYTDPWS